MSSTTTSKRVLIVAYLFPPTGGVSVQRIRKFVKYLPEFGWDATVLTASNPSVPLRDESLLDEIPDQTTIRTARTLEPGYGMKQMVAATSAPTSDDMTRWIGDRLLSGVKGMTRSVVNTLLQPDTAILWYPQAVGEGLRILRQEAHDAILVTAPPFSSLMVGAALARRTGVPLILDYRDEWTINKAYLENCRQDQLSNWVQQRMQKSVLRAAHTVVATTPGSARALGTLAQQAGSSATSTHIYNGYDPDDFQQVSAATRQDFGHGLDRLRIAYVGTLWKLTTIEPFVNAVECLASTRPDLLDRLEVVVAGRHVSAEQSHLQRLAALPCHFTNVGFLEHGEALQLMATSDWLLQLLSDLPSVNRVIASKLFEYLGARRPILAISGPGDHWDLVQQIPGATLLHPHDTQQIADTLANRLQTHNGTLTEPLPEYTGTPYERRHLTAQLAQLLDGIVGKDISPATTSETATLRPLAEALA